MCLSLVRVIYLQKEEESIIKNKIHFIPFLFLQPLLVSQLPHLVTVHEYNDDKTIKSFSDQCMHLCLNLYTGPQVTPERE